MRTKMRTWLPLLLALVIVSSSIGGWYWYDNNVDRSGWVEKNGVRFYRDFHADPVSGWLELEDGYYYFLDDGTPHTGWQEIDGTAYYFNETGVMHTGWLELDTGRYYLQTDGTCYTGWQSIDGVTYYFSDSGIMHTGWLEQENQLYYFGGNGAMVEGWLWLEEGRYYLKDGALLTGWQEIDGNRYHFSEKGLAALGFAEIDGNRYYFNDGILATGLTTIDGETYNFGEDGILRTGWMDFEDGRRYFSPQGNMATGWLEIDGSRYLFTEEGRLITGWHREGENQYYFHEDGRAAVGPTVIDGQQRYFSPKGIHVILVNGLNPVPDWFQLDPVNVVDYHDVDRLCYDALNTMLADLTAAGIEYTFNSAYRTITEQRTILEYRTREHMKNFNMEFNEARNKAYETVAIPGTSEHNLGLAVDLLGAEAVAWLSEHCWDYGFIVRYTAEKEPITGIVDEPWHFRYVGKEVALDMKGSGLCLEEYLGAEAVTWDKIVAAHGDSLYTETIWKPAET